MEDKDTDWIGKSYREAFALADTDTRKDAEALLPQLGGPDKGSAKTVKISPSGRAAPPKRALAKQTTPEPSLSARDEPRLGPVDVMPPAAMGLSVGFGASEDGLGALQP